MKFEKNINKVRYTFNKIRRNSILLIRLIIAEIKQALYIVVRRTFQMCLLRSTAVDVQYIQQNNVLKDLDLLALFIELLLLSNF